MTNTTLHHQDHFSERVFERIKDEHVRPRPRWEFLLKNYFFWALGVLAVVFGALAVAAMLFEITNVEWGAGIASGSSLTAFLFEALPFFWAITLALFILIGYLNIRWTNHGYRYSLALIALGAILTSLALGTGLYLLDVGRAVEETVDSHTPFHRSILRHIRELPQGIEMRP